MKTVIVGAVDSGASCAARLRRLDESAEIVMVEKGPNVSYPNCGLPYLIGGIIEQEKSLAVANAELFRQQFGIDARTQCEAIAIESVPVAVNIPLGQLRERPPWPHTIETEKICKARGRIIL